MAKDTNYYNELKNYFNLGLDFLDTENEMGKLQITDYYDDGTIKQYYVDSYDQLLKNS